MSALPKGSLIAALDIGTSKIACFICRITEVPERLELIGVGHHASAGVEAASISDITAAEGAVRQAVHAAENMAADVMKGYPLREVVVNMPGVHAASVHQRVDVDISGHEINEKDILHALNQAQDDVWQENRELIHTIAVDYEIDGKAGIQDPKGMYGETMAVGVHFLDCDSHAMKNISTCIERSHLDISAFCLSSYAAGLASLVEDEMDLGCTVIDIGGGTTSLAVFQGRKLIYADAIPLGGKHVTNDIAKGLGTATADAERIKVLYGSALATSSDETEMIDIPPLGEHDIHESNHVPRSLLVGIIQPRLEEILEFARGRLQDSGLGPSLGRRVVLTGGASQIQGLRDLAQHVLDKQVRLGRPIRLSGLPDAVSGPDFATTAGLLTYIVERGHEIPDEISTENEGFSLWEKLKYWLKENW